MHILGEQLKKLRMEHKLTQAEMGEIMGVSARVYAYYESGARFPKKSSAIADVAMHFDVTADWLIRGGESVVSELMSNSYSATPRFVEEFCGSDEGQKMIAVLCATGVTYYELKEALLMYEKQKKNPS